MSAHWLHVALSWGAAILVFASLAGAAAIRHRAARRALARLLEDPRP